MKTDNRRAGTETVGERQMEVNKKTATLAIVRFMRHTSFRNEIMIICDDKKLPRPDAK
jgi:hypothetical protein